jgi:hypothetical protein
MQRLSIAQRHRIIRSRGIEHDFAVEIARVATARGLSDRQVVKLLTRRLSEAIKAGKPADRATMLGILADLEAGR